MSLGEIFSNSIKYPFSDITNFAIVAVIVLIASLSTVVKSFGIDNAAVIFLTGIIALIFSILLSGYCISIIKKGIENSDEFPDIDLKKNFIDGIKSFIIYIVYFIIPAIIVVVLAVLGGAIGASVDNIPAALGIFTIIAIILFIIFIILAMVALARFANTDKLGEAFKFGEVIEDIKRIGIFNIIAFMIIALVIVVVAYIIDLLISSIPYVGIIISTAVVGAFVSLFYHKALGLLYASA